MLRNYDTQIIMILKPGAHLGGRGDTTPVLKKKSDFEQAISTENAPKNVSNALSLDS